MTKNKINKSVKKNKKTLFRKLINFVLLGIVVASGINLYIIAYANPYIYSIEDLETSDYDAVMALGAKVWPSGTLSYILRDRVNRAMDVYEQGKAKKVLLSGDHGQQDYDEVNAMMNAALARKIPEQDIFLDHAGFSTYDSMVRAKAVFQCKRLIVVTQPFHLYRAVYIARKSGIDAVGVKADQTNYVLRIDVKNQLREFLARIKAFIYVEFLNPAPSYLGDPIPISEDGRLTHDQ